MSFPVQMVKWDYRSLVYQLHLYSFAIATPVACEEWKIVFSADNGTPSYKVSYRALTCFYTLIGKSQGFWLLLCEFNWINMPNFSILKCGINEIDSQRTVEKESWTENVATYRRNCERKWKLWTSFEVLMILLLRFLCQQLLPVRWYEAKVGCRTTP